MRAVVKVDWDAKPRPYWRNLGEAVSQVLHAIIGGDANLTFSAMCGYWLLINDRRGRVFAPIVDFLFGKNHCANAWRNLT